MVCRIASPSGTRVGEGLIALAIACVLSLAGCSSGGASGGSCSPRCTSGCCLDGQCAFGTQQNACGTSGMTCVACPGGTTCNNGQCVPSSNCGPGTCAGCCSGNQCVQFSQQASSLCGTSGTACASCGGQACNGGICGGSSGACNSTNCAGCCTASGQCLQLGQQSPAQCGVGGQYCTSCGGGACQNGSCSGGGNCNSTNCAGCCSGGQCLQFSQQSPWQCGRGGQACLGCGGASCTNGECQGSSGACANCAGCCQNNVCIPFASQGPMACGSAGSYCQSCPAPGVCQYGSCSGASGCSPTSCFGCCMGNQCLTTAQQSSAACGLGGQICQQCGSGASCTNGQCQGCNALTCGDGCCQYNQCLKKNQQSSAACGLSGNSCTACPGGQSCVDGQCMVAWRVIGVSAKVKPRSTPWDEVYVAGPDPDPFLVCRVQIGGKSGQTKTVDNTYAPAWNTEMFTDSQQNLLSGLRCEVRDDDFLNSELMGDCPVFPQGSQFSNSVFSVTSSGCSSYVQEIRVQFVRM